MKMGENNSLYDSDDSSDIEQMLNKVRKKSTTAATLARTTPAGKPPSSLSSSLSPCESDDDNDDEPWQNDSDVRSHERKRKLNDTEKKLLRFEQKCAMRERQRLFDERKKRINDDHVSDSDRDDDDDDNGDELGVSGRTGVKASKAKSKYAIDIEAEVEIIGGEENGPSRIHAGKSMPTDDKDDDDDHEDCSSEEDEANQPTIRHHHCLASLEVAAAALKSANRACGAAIEVVDLSESPVANSYSPLTKQPSSVMIKVRPKLVEYNSSKSVVKPVVELMVQGPEKMAQLHKQLIQSLGLNASTSVVTLMYQGRTLKTHQSVTSCGFEHGALLEATVHLTGFESIAPLAAAASVPKMDLGPTISLALRQHGAEQVNLRIRMKERLQTLVDQYRQVKSLPSSQQIVLWFDGDQLTLDQTPASLDMESEDLIDVQVR